MTSAGRALLDAAYPIADEVLAESFAHFTEVERATLLESLMQIGGAE